MQFTDEAIVISCRKHAESSRIATVLTRDHGLYGGVLRGGKNSGTWQPGNRVLVTWNARLAEHLGHFTGELLEDFAGILMLQADTLASLNSATTLTQQCLPERAPHPELFDALTTLLNTLKHGEDWLSTYADFEMELLSSCGFRLDLGQCAATGITEDLCYVSPMSGRAVSRTAGEPYKDKMLPLPVLLLGGKGPRAGAGEGTSPSELHSALITTGYFLHHWVLEPHGKTLPAARNRLIEALKPAENHVKTPA